MQVSVVKLCSTVLNRVYWQVVVDIRRNAWKHSLSVHKDPNLMDKLAALSDDSAAVVVPCQIYSFSFGHNFYHGWVRPLTLARH